jgi:hypothetical protein
MKRLSVRHAEGELTVPAVNTLHPAHVGPTRREPGGRAHPDSALQTKPTMGFEPMTPALRERCSGQLSYVGVVDECSPGWPRRTRTAGRLPGS